MKSPADWRGLNWRAWLGLAGSGTRIERQSQTERLLPGSASVRFKVRAMLAARVFFRAIVFNVRTSDDVHDRRFDFLGI
jgi:hypothetical protein